MNKGTMSEFLLVGPYVNKGTMSEFLLGGQVCE